MEYSDSDIDHVREYAKAVVWGGLSDMVRHDAIRANDGDCIIRHW